MSTRVHFRYTMLYGACRALGALPDGVLYGGIGGLLYFLLYVVIGYRVSVVRENLSSAFPEKSEREHLEIERRYYRHLTTLFIDTIVMFSTSPSKVLRRMSYTNIAEHEERVKGKSWIAAMSHFGSWELTTNYALVTSHRVLGVYRPLKNQPIDLFYRKMRSQYGTEPVAMEAIYREVLRGIKFQQQPLVVALLADQTPPFHEVKDFHYFLNQDTAFFPGMEKISLRLHLPIYFMDIRSTQRSRYYEAEFVEIYDGEEPISEYELTERYVKLLEAQIRREPHLWLWSHRRWKFKREMVEQRWAQDALEKQKS